MTTPAFPTTLDAADPSVRSDAQDLADQLDGDSPLETAIRSMLGEIARGRRLIVLRPEDDLTPSQAANILGVSRQFVDRLCDDGVLPFRRLPASRHRRIRVQDVLDVAAEREQRRTGAEAIRSVLGN